MDFVINQAVVLHWAPFDDASAAVARNNSLVDFSQPGVSVRLHKTRFVSKSIYLCFTFYWLLLTAAFNTEVSNSKIPLQMRFSFDGVPIIVSRTVCFLSLNNTTSGKKYSISSLLKYAFYYVI